MQKPYELRKGFAKGRGIFYEMCGSILINPLFLF